MTTTKWNLDPTHSEIQFKVRHMMITNVSGEFKKFEANVETEGDDFSTAKIQFSADVDSIDTKNEQRDGHLKSADFFDAANHPTLSFVGTEMEKKDPENYILHGNFTMRGNTKPIALNVEHGGTVVDAWGNTRAGFTIEGKLSRKEFGLEWSAVTETGGIVVSDEVKLHVSVQFIKQPA
ncbi:MAG: YceI family protein [Bacteroidota bacterium]